MSGSQPSSATATAGAAPAHAAAGGARYVRRSGSLRASPWQGLGLGLGLVPEVSETTSPFPDEDPPATDTPTSVHRPAGQSEGTSMAASAQAAGPAQEAGGTGAEADQPQSQPPGLLGLPGLGRQGSSMSQVQSPTAWLPEVDSSPLTQSFLRNSSSRGAARRLLLGGPPVAVSATQAADTGKHLGLPHSTASGTEGGRSAAADGAALARVRANVAPARSADAASDGIFDRVSGGHRSSKTEADAGADTPRFLPYPGPAALGPGSFFSDNPRPGGRGGTAAVATANMVRRTATDPSLGHPQQQRSPPTRTVPGVSGTHTTLSGSGRPVMAAEEVAVGVAAAAGSDEAPTANGRTAERQTHVDMLLAQDSFSGPVVPSGPASCISQARTGGSTSPFMPQAAPVPQPDPAHIRRSATAPSWRQVATEQAVAFARKLRRHESTPANEPPQAAASTTTTAAAAPAAAAATVAAFRPSATFRPLATYERHALPPGSLLSGHSHTTLTTVGRSSTLNGLESYLAEADEDGDREGDLPQGHSGSTLGGPAAAGSNAAGGGGGGGGSSKAGLPDGVPADGALDVELLPLPPPDALATRRGASRRQGGGGGPHSPKVFHTVSHHAPRRSRPGPPSPLASSLASPVDGYPGHRGSSALALRPLSGGGITAHSTLPPAPTPPQSAALARPSVLPPRMGSGGAPLSPWGPLSPTQPQELLSSRGAGGGRDPRVIAAAAPNQRAASGPAPGLPPCRYQPHPHLSPPGLAVASLPGHMTPPLAPPAPLLPAAIPPRDSAGGGGGGSQGMALVSPPSTPGDSTLYGSRRMSYGAGTGSIGTLITWPPPLGDVTAGLGGGGGGGGSGRGSSSIWNQHPGGGGRQASYDAVHPYAADEALLQTCTTVQAWLQVRGTSPHTCPAALK